MHSHPSSLSIRLAVPSHLTPILAAFADAWASVHERFPHARDYLAENGSAGTAE